MPRSDVAGRSWRRLMPLEVDRLRSLRAADPERWTFARLAELFEVSTETAWRHCRPWEAPRPRPYRRRAGVPDTPELVAERAKWSEFEATMQTERQRVRSLGARPRR